MMQDQKISVPHGLPGSAQKRQLLCLLGHYGRSLDNLRALGSGFFLSVGFRGELGQVDTFIAAVSEPGGNQATIQNSKNKNECCWKLLSLW